MQSFVGERSRAWPSFRRVIDSRRHALEDDHRTDQRGAPQGLRLRGWRRSSSRLSLGEWARKGDFVELAGHDETIVFMIRARRIRVDANDMQTLVFELDHPPRPAVR
ncbi:hypothetical protein A33O_18184 [Nitratireductor aquibiodomus RA22]|uniref:Uncharacterized protein n=1 Tax=Nitratireductor aquibiodomus RA22 TaxID=1189611 RepID=I5BT96_9HYPH|nr:hypothetical protein [Nitratireductor aquibiodomus]EIM72798.1 hypothetical protein A33O_18184 [Nitratireductor aquibiodomus RA22]